MPTARLVFITELRRLNMISGGITCCYGCTMRSKGCHAVCEEYAAEKAENDRKRKERYKQNCAIRAYYKDRNTKIKRKMQRR